MSKVKPHSGIAKFFHWGFIGLFGYGFYKGLNNVDQLADTALLNFEMGFAAVFLAFLGARFLYMKATRPTSLPKESPKLIFWLARATHLGIYFSVALIALSGLMIGGLYMAGITSGAIMALVIGLHELAIGASISLIVAHVTAAICHRIIGDGVWSSMVPVWKER